MKRLLLVLLIFLAGCRAQNNPPGPEGAEATSTPYPTSPAATRPTYTVQRGTVEEVMSFSGRWLPRDQFQLSFPIQGSARRVEVARDQTVTQGQLLADLQIDDLEDQLATAELELESALRDLQTGSEGSTQPVLDAQLNLANANLNLESSEENLPWTSVANARIAMEAAQRELDDAQRAYDDLISRADSAASAVDSAYSRLQSAKENIRQAQNNYYSAAQSYNNYLYTIKQNENQVVANEIALEQAEAGIGIDADLVQAVTIAQMNVDNLKEEIAQATLVAPFDGVVVEVLIQPGDAVEAYSVVITIARPEPKEVVASIPFNDSQQLSISMVGVCEVFNMPDSAVLCAVRQIPLSSNDVDQTVRLAAALEGTPQGQRIEITMPLETRENVLWLPPAAIRTFQNRTFVVVQTPDGERVADVEIGLETDERVEIISGVEEGEIIVGP